MILAEKWQLRPWGRDRQSQQYQLEKLENGRSYLLSKKDHGASNGFRGNQYEIEVVGPQDEDLAKPKTEDKNIFGKIIENFLKYKIITRE